MAKLVRTELTCDRCGASDDTVRTHSIVIDGDAIEAELCSDDMHFLEAWRELGRKASKAPAKGTPRDRETPKKVRAWGKRVGVFIDQRGRIPIEVMEQWRAEGSPDH